MVAARVVIAALLFASVARADNPSLVRARAALDRSDYPGAQAAIGEALADGSSGPDEVAEIYRVSGIVAAALGNAKAATIEFERMLALAPKATLPAGTSPKITRPFGEAQAAMAKQPPLRITVETRSAPPAVIVAVASDPRSMIARVRATARIDGGAEQVIERPAARQVTIDLPAMKQRIDVRVAVLDDHGNRLAETGSADVPLVIVGGGASPRPKPVKPPPVEPTPEAPRGPRPLYAKWWLWGSVAVAFTATGGVFAYLTHDALEDLRRLNAESSSHMFTEAQAVESRARRNLVITDNSLGLAGATAIAATILYVTGRGSSRERRAAIRPVPAARGAGLVVEVPF